MFFWFCLGLESEKIVQLKEDGFIFLSFAIIEFSHAFILLICLIMTQKCYFYPVTIAIAKC